MKYIANIVTDSNIEASQFIKVSKDINDVDLSLPTLIIGWNKMKSYFPEQDILERKIGNGNLYWTFSKREKRSEYEDDIEKFKSIINDSIDKKINYKFFNYILAKDSKKNSFKNYMKKGGKYVYINNNFIYIYDGNSTTGLSLSDLNYCGIDKNVFLNELNSNLNNVLFYNLENTDKQLNLIIKKSNKMLPMLKYMQEH